MVPDARSSTSASNRLFDFNSQVGVLQVLAAIRKSDCTTAVRNELRDLVFLYSNGGGDVAVRNVLEERLQTYNITLSEVAAAENVVLPAPVVIQQSGFASGRPAPVFVSGVAMHVPRIETTTVVTQKIAHLTPDTIQNAEQLAPPHILQTPAVVTVPFSVASTPVPVPYQSPVVVKPVLVAPSEIVPEARPVLTRIIPTIPVATPVVVSQAVSVTRPEIRSNQTQVQAPDPTVATGSVLSPSTEARLERIRVIKALVNGQVGNPVNLVDINNEIGREYMSALLEAMKLLNSASEIESARAMSRLEAVFVQVTTLLDPALVVAPVVVALPVVPPPTPYPVAPVYPVFPVAETSTVIVPTFAHETGTPKDPIFPNNVGTIDPILPAVSAPSPKVLIVPPTNGVVENEQNKIQPQISVAVAAQPLRIITDLPTADQVNKSSAALDPLFTKEVDNGLNQLLSEWMLFKKSGLFGTGPSGREHPLFIKIASLQIPLLLSGRFEGATQDIKQSVTDYMNGWRYEQGIVYEKGETFEHYLRRVIRHIIDWQNKKRST